MSSDNRIWPTEPIDWIAIGFCLIALAVAAWIFWRYPDFRRAFVEHWKPEAVAKRLNEWAERTRR
jgi:hypothetical protein